MFLAGNTQTVTRVRPTGRDAFGDPVTGTADEVDIPGCLFAPGGSSESAPGENANSVGTSGTLYAPSGSDILNTDQLLIRDDLYDITGTPQAWGTSGLVVEVRRNTG